MCGRQGMWNLLLLGVSRTFWKNKQTIGAIIPHIYYLDLGLVCVKFNCIYLGMRVCLMGDRQQTYGCTAVVQC